MSPSLGRAPERLRGLPERCAGGIDGKRAGYNLCFKVNSCALMKFRRMHFSVQMFGVNEKTEGLFTQTKIWHIMQKNSKVVEIRVMWL